MDYLRSCYSSSFRLYNDRPDVLVPGRWHFCPPGAKLAQMPHIFGSQVWTPKNMEIDPPLGEVLGRGPWFDGKPDSRFVGQHFCGSPRVWLEGIPFADRPGLVLEPDGTPACCHAPPAVPEFTSGGDLEIDGGAEGGDVFIGAKARASVPLPLTLNPTRVAFTSVLWDTDGFFDLDVDAQAINPARDGVYLVGCQVEWLWFPPAVGTRTVQVRVRHAAGDAVFETQGIVDQASPDTIAQQSPAVESRLYVALPAFVDVFVIGSVADLASLVVYVWVEFRGDPPPVLFPLVTESGDQLVTGDGDPLMGES
jgi:hypothetical protein